MVDNCARARVTPAVITEAVWAAKQFLDEKLDKCETFQEFENSLVPVPARTLFTSTPTQKEFSFLRSAGVGREIIVRLLGVKWENPVREALSALAEDAARAQAERLRRRQEREATKAEAARQEAARQEQLRREAEERAEIQRQEAERLAQEKADREARQAEEERVRVGRLAGGQTGHVSGLGAARARARARGAAPPACGKFATSCIPSTRPWGGPLRFHEFYGRF